MFLQTLRSTWWLGSYKLQKAMVDYQLNLDWCLGNSSLFPAEPFDDDLFNFDDVTIKKANDEEYQPAADLSDLGWLDQKVDLSLFDIPNDSLAHPNETETLMIDDAEAILGDLVNFDSLFLPSDLKAEDVDIKAADIDCVNGDSLPRSPVDQDAARSPSNSSMSSPYSPISSIPSPYTGEDNSDVSPDSVQVTVCDSPPPVRKNPPLQLAEIMTIEEVSKSVKKRKYTRRGRDIPVVHVDLNRSFHPYSSQTSAPRRASRYERKKVQNKEAAARYRIKRKMEELVRSDEVSVLEEEQKELVENKDQLQNEIKYLKGLMREMFKARGILK